MIPITRMAALAAALALGATPAGAVVVTGAYNGVVRLQDRDIVRHPLVAEMLGVL